jgi:hypothetical protein
MFNLWEDLVQQRSYARAGGQAIIARTASQIQGQDQDSAAVCLAVSCGALITIDWMNCLPSVRAQD